jgi:hypothetical protein|tara:strand:+ start:192 stop:698 length:507 start_codon:yes stop_codon:yes gene_type:complete
MPKKLAKTRGKGGRPSKQKQVEIRKKCEEEYLNYHSASYAARVLGLNPHTVEKYYRSFQEAELEETNRDFVIKQRAVKNKVISRLDEILDQLGGQYRDISGVLQDDTQGEFHDIARYEAMKTTVLKSMSDILQQKASIETTPTLDITIDKYIEETYGKSVSEKVAKPK